MTAWLDRHGTRLAYALLAAIVLGAAVVRFVGIGDYWLNPDEGIYYSVISWPDLARRQAEIAENAHPPFYYHLLWAWSRVSMDIAWLRSLAALAGVAGVFGMFLLGRELIGSGRGLVTGLIAALLLACSPASIVLSQLIRPYTLQVALIVFGLFGLARWHRRGSRPALCVFAGAMSLALVTHYSSVFALAAAGLPFLFLLARRQLSRRAITDLAVACAVPFVVGFAIYFVYVRANLAGSALQQNAYATWLRPHLAIDFTHAWRQAIGFCGYLFGDSLSGTGMFAFLIALGTAFWLRVSVVWVAPVTIFLAAAAASRAHLYPFGPARHSVYLTPFLLLPIAWVLARGISAAPRVRWITAGTLAASLLGQTWLYVTLTNGLRVSRVGQEQVLLVRDLETIRPRLEQLKTTPGLLVTSQDSYLALGPLWQHEREASRMAEGMRVFQWGERTVLVHSEWAFSMQGTDLGKGGGHLYDFLVKADRVLPELQVGKQRRLTTLFAGFHTAAMEGLIEYDSQRRAPTRLVANAITAQGCGIVDLDAPTFGAEAAAALAKQPPQAGGSTGR